LSSGAGDVIAELVRALIDIALMPARACFYWLKRKQLESEARSDLECTSLLTQLPQLPPGKGQAALEIFVACAEPSGEKHAANLVDAIRELEKKRGAPEPRFVGLGGAILAERGVEIIGDPVSRAAMGFDVFSNLPFYMQLLASVAKRMEHNRPDLFLPVDSPALHVPLSHIAKRHRVPVVHFVTPQYWGWAPWRVGGYRRAVDLALCILPFEEPWFRRHQVPVAHVGHPLLDELADISSGAESTKSQTAPILALLPGSRRHVVTRNLPWMLKALENVKRSIPELQVVVPQSDAGLVPLLEELVKTAGASDWVRIASGNLHAELEQARAAFSVSGTILIDLLHRRLPTVVLYRLSNARQNWLYKNFLTCPYFSSVNLIAGKEVLPEFCFHAGDPNEPMQQVAEAVERSLSDETWRAECRDGLDLAAKRLGPPGAVARAAEHAVGIALSS
jgi:lipid-A-disaccharide synthase